MSHTPTLASRVNLISNIFHKLATQNCQDRVLEGLDPEVYQVLVFFISDIFHKLATQHCQDRFIFSYARLRPGAGSWGNNLLF
jgi:hypothetical protein